MNHAINSPLTQAASRQAAQARVRAYAERVFRRCDGADEVIPADHRQDGADAPARFRTYPGQFRIALPGPAHLQQQFDAARAAAGEQPQLAQLSLLLYLMLAPLRRKVDLNWNFSEPNIGFLQQEFGRGTASGGGLYPTQVYLVAGAGGALPPGVYHYCVAEHALVALRLGRYEASLAAALGSDAVHPYYLVLAPDFWTNCHKYHNFGIHVCSQDTGALLAAVQMGCDTLGIAQRSTTIFDDAGVNAVIGVDGEHETAFAVAALGLPRQSATEAASGALGPVAQPWQKSRRVRIAPELSEVAQLSKLDARLLPQHLQDSHAGPWTPPAADGCVEARLRSALPSVLQARRSAWGSLYAEQPVSAAQLLELLGFVWRRAGPEHAPLREALPLGSLGLVVQVNRGGDLACGAYRYDPAAHALQALQGAALAHWQTTYAGHNYNIDEAGCALFVTGDLDAVMAQYGARGYRLLNACVGLVSQLCYVGASALRLDCGVVLGARAQHVKRSLALPAQQNVCLAVYLSQPQEPVHLFDYTLIPDVPHWKSLT
jgi:SagB-type dehydrogenase family enzyme